MKRLLSVGIAILCFGVLPAAQASAEKRLALIIVNQDYSQDMGWLAHTLRDGELVKSALEDAGFDVRVSQNRNYLEMWDDITGFSQDLSREVDQKPGEKPVGLFYYSGHGASDGSDNYLIPVRTDIRSNDDLSLKGISERKIVEMFSRIENDNNFIVLDACRSIAFTKALGKGLLPVQVPNQRAVRNILVAHSASS